MLINGEVSMQSLLFITVPKCAAEGRGSLVRLEKFISKQVENRL